LLRIRAKNKSNPGKTRALLAENSCMCYSIHNKTPFYNNDSATGNRIDNRLPILNTVLGATHEF